jgi:hypothetical protein
VIRPQRAGNASEARFAGAAVLGIWIKTRKVTGISLHYPMLTMASAKEIAKDITAVLPHVKDGSLRFWDEWFGRPFDNCHRLMECNATDGCLRLRFDEDEILAVWNPTGVEIDETTFRIGSATDVRWTWYYYGRTKTSENLRYRDYAQGDGWIAY